MTDISGKLVLVTGAASGIGRATAQTAAERGARVVLTDISPLDETIATIQAAGGEVERGLAVGVGWDHLDDGTAGPVELGCLGDDLADVVSGGRAGGASDS